jgi:Domain of unknown function (DUF222)/HNH endonuclease
VDVERELALLCGVLNQSYARLVAVVAQALSNESWAIAGVRSPEHWLSIRAGLSPFHARQVVAVARRRDEMPSVMSEFAEGQLSLDQVGVVARYAPAHVEASVAELAVHTSVPQLRRALSRYSFDPPAGNGYTEQTTTFPTAIGDSGSGDSGTNDSGTNDSGTNDGEAGNVGSDPDGPATWNGLALVEDRASAPAELSMSHDQWGRFTLRFNASADLGALIEAALKEAKDALFGPKDTDTERREVNWADALVEIAGRSLGAAESINRRNAYRTYIHLDSEGAWLTGKPRLPAHLAAKLTCDGILQPVWHTQGAPVNVGRAQRIVPARTRRLVEDRDRGCRFPGCSTTAHVECHHLIHWADGGPTDTSNLACLCPFHHDAHHNREFNVKGDADSPSGLTFTTRRGFPIRSGPTFTTPISPGSSPSSGPPDSPESPGEAGPDDARLPSLSPPRAMTVYRGPSGDKLNLRWVTFHEPLETAVSI